ncbi:MAG: extracellular solute-binding protein, partial [Propionibacteriaceae bacterium]|nr:extracellular solute-binding protein [Propionibacteriaceae bacterium]
MSYRRSLILAVVVALAFTGCSKPSDLEPGGPSTAAPTRPTLTDDFIERIDGSTATIPLMSATLRFLRGTDTGLRHNTTPAAYSNLIAGEKDLIFVTAPSEEELAEAQAAGVELEVIPIVKDALVYLVNAANPVAGLTDQQIREIYTGKVTNWAETGGENRPIIPYQRETNSGSQTLFLQLTMRGTPPTDAPSELRPATMSLLVDAISTYDNSQAALGYSMFYYAQQMYVKDNVKLLNVDGVTPSMESISDDSYPYGTYYYAVMRADTEQDAIARALVNWMLSDEAQQLASANSYVPLNPRNIVPRQTDYGYYGSTPANTSQSSGTGGTVGQRASDTAPLCGINEYGGPLTCLDNVEAHTPNVTVPGYPAAEAAVQAWIEENPPVGSSWGAWRSQSGRGLFGIEYQTGDLRQFRSAVFRLSDGQQLTLADLFFDGVNYIELINRHLIDEHTNHALQRCSTGVVAGCWPGTLIGDFTGIPNDYPLFGLELATGLLTIQFPPGNPFLVSFDSDAQSRQPIRLPADLSPYGDYWRYDYVRIGDCFVEHLVRDYGGPNPIDTILNANIDALVAT